MKERISPAYENYLLNSNFMSIANELQRNMPEGKTVFREHGTFLHPIQGFMRMIRQLERLFFIGESETEYPVYNSLYYNCSQAGRNASLLEEETPKYKTGFSITKAASTIYNEHPNSRHLDAAEEFYKVTPSHFLKIYTANNILFVYTNKDLPLETIIELKLLQWNITKDNFTTPCPLVEELLSALRHKKADDANRIIDEIFKLGTFKEFRYEKFRKVFMPNYEKKINEMEHEISEKENDYLYYENYLADLIVRIQDLQEQLAIYRTQADKEEDTKPFLDYLFRHPYITEITKQGDYIVDLYYEAPIIYYDKYLIKKIYPNHPENHQKVLDIFLDNKYELMTRCCIRFNTQTFNIDRIETPWDARYIGHPHIDRYSCFGNHRLALRDAARDANYFGAIEQISEAVLNLNFSDSTVINNMLWILTETPEKETWRSKETGDILSTEQVLEVYENEETQTDSQ